MDAVRQIRDIRAHREVIERRKRIYICRRRKNPFLLLTEKEFIRRYRVTKKTAKFVINLVKPNLVPMQLKRTSITPELQVLIALRFYAKGIQQEDNGDLHGVSQKSVSNIVKKVSVELASHLHHFVKFADDINSVKQDFYAVAGFPNVVGCIDCTHVKIKNPYKERPLLYCNRKGYYSLNIQVVCDANCRITDLVARWRGSAHDARIWDECSLKERFENNEIRGILLGDGGYACRHFLLTPLLIPKSPAEIRYNTSHIRTRTTVERLFGQWKALFRALQMGMAISLDTVKAAISAMAVIHNIRIDKDRNNYEEDDSDSDLQRSDSEDEMPVLADNEQNIRGSVYRARFIRDHFS